MSDKKEVHRAIAAELRRCALIMAKRGVSAELDSKQPGVGREWKADLEGQALAYERAAAFLDKRADRLSKKGKKR